MEAVLPKVLLSLLTLLVETLKNTCECIITMCYYHVNLQL